jgi:hypothetical protein
MKRLNEQAKKLSVAMIARMKSQSKFSRNAWAELNGVRGQ